MGGLAASVFLSQPLSSSEKEQLRSLQGQVKEQLPENSLFGDLCTSSRFFEQDQVGYAPAQQRQKMNSMELRTSRWEVRPLGLVHLSSSFFDDPSLFPAGSIHFDHVLSMRNLEHEWHEAKRPSL